MGFIDTFATRFDHFSIHTEVMRFMKDPFCVNVEGDLALKANELVTSLNEASLQLKLIAIVIIAGMFWTHEVRHEKFPHSRGLAFFYPHNVWLYLYM